jgi:phenylacetate-CoA ligase
MDANYGMSDVLSMFGAECEVRDGLHFMGQGALLPELKALGNDEIIPWEPGARGELVLTNIRKECQPLVRYRAHDIIEVTGMGPCGCGRRSPRFRVAGRLEDMIVVKGINVSLSSIAEVVNRHSDVLTGEFRVLVDKTDPIEHCVIKVEARSGKVREGLSHELEGLFKDALYVSPRVEIVPEARLPRTDEKTQRLERIL